jgi:hypothetical protein
LSLSFLYVYLSCRPLVFLNFNLCTSLFLSSSTLLQESAHVTLVSDAHLPQRFSKPPQPVMSDDGSALKNKWCPQFKWRFCPNPKRGDEDRNW